MIHIYAHGSPMGFTFMDKDGNITEVRTGKQLVEFLNKNSRIWNERRKGETMYIALHSCSFGKVNNLPFGVGSWIKDFIDLFPTTVFIAPNSLLEITKEGEDVFKNEYDSDSGNWLYYQMSTKPYLKTDGNPPNNPDLINYVRPKDDLREFRNSWRKVNSFLDKVSNLGIPVYFY